jgi:hypothetical protein
MDTDDLKIKVKDIVEKATALKNKHINDKNTPVNYACIFSQSQEEYDELLVVSKKIGKVIEEMPSGVLFQINPLNTVSGVLQILKIRIPDTTRPELGDADFTVQNYPDFKKKYLPKKGWKLIKKREDFEMLELMDSNFNVRVYFSNPPLDEQLNIK